MVGAYQRLDLLLCEEGRYGRGSSKTVQLVSLFIYCPHGKNQEKHAFFWLTERKSSSLLIKKEKTVWINPRLFL